MAFLVLWANFQQRTYSWYYFVPIDAQRVAASVFLPRESVHSAHPYGALDSTEKSVNRGWMAVDHFYVLIFFSIIWGFKTLIWVHFDC